MNKAKNRLLVKIRKNSLKPETSLKETNGLNPSQEAVRIRATCIRDQNAGFRRRWVTVTDKVDKKAMENVDVISK